MQAKYIKMDTVSSRINQGAGTVSRQTHAAHSRHLHEWVQHFEFHCLFSKITTSHNRMSNNNNETTKMCCCCIAHVLPPARGVELCLDDRLSSSRGMLTSCAASPAGTLSARLTASIIPTVM